MKMQPHPYICYLPARIWDKISYNISHGLHGKTLVDYLNSRVLYLCKEMNSGFNWLRTETWSSGHCFAGPWVTCLMHLPVSTAFNTLWVNIDPFPARAKGQHVYCTSRPSPLGERKPTLIRLTTRNFKSVLAQAYLTQWWFNTSMWDLSSRFPSTWEHGTVCYRLVHTHYRAQSPTHPLAVSTDKTVCALDSSLVKCILPLCGKEEKCITIGQWCFSHWGLQSNV